MHQLRSAPAATTLNQNIELAGLDTRTIGVAMNLDETEARRRFATARHAYLTTVGIDGQPHLVPVTFAARGDTVVIAVDSKPKTTTNLKRLRNITENAKVSVLVDEYHDSDWRRLWWVRADGVAQVLTGTRDRITPLTWLREKYPQYRDDVPTGPVIWIDVSSWRGWAHAG